MDIKRSTTTLAAIAALSIVPATAFGATSHSPTNGNDRLRGTANADVIDGLAGNDRILGLAGDDKLMGSAGNDRLFGMDGNDALSGGAGNDLVAGGKGDDQISGDANGTGDLTSYDRLFGNAGNDTIQGGDSRDKIRGGDGNDTSRGENGRDLMAGGKGDDTQYGGAGDDTIFANVGVDRSYGGDGNDNLWALARKDVVGPNDTTGDTLEGGSGNDRFHTRDGEQDSVLCGDGNDTALLDFKDVIADATPGDKNGSCEHVIRKVARDSDKAENAEQSTTEEKATS